MRFVTLTPEEDEAADVVGIGRTQENEKSGRGDRASYDPSLILSDNSFANRMAARAELGVAKWYGAKWLGKVWPVSEHYLHADEPDSELGPIGIETKWRRTGGWGVPLDVKDAEQNHLIVWAGVNPARNADELTTVQIVGERFASELWEVAKPGPRGDKRRRYADPIHLLKPGDVLGRK